MRVLLLLCLLTLVHTKPPVHFLDLLKDHDLMMQDADEEDDEDEEDDDCPFGCQCVRRVVQCSDLGLLSIPDHIPTDTMMIDLQNNDITEIRENDFKGLDKLYALFLVNNKIATIHPGAFRGMERLRLLYLSYNQLTQIPPNMPRNILELRLHDNKISRIQKDAFKGMKSLHVLEMTANPLANSGIELGAFDGMSTLYIRMAEAKLTAIPKDLPSSLTELHLDYNSISKVEIEDFYRYKNLERLGLGFNQIRLVENGSLDSIPNVREIHLDHNKLKKVPPGLSALRDLQVVYLHANSIRSVGVNDLCPASPSRKKRLYTGVSLFANPVRYWDLQPATFRCVSPHRSLQLGNFRRK